MARIIKADRTRVVRAPVVDARAEAARIREKATEEAVAQAEAARRAGEAAGREEGLASVTEMLARARLEHARRAADEEPALRRLAVRIAEKILGRELAITPDAVVDIVRTALASARDRSRLTLRVHPEDLATVTAARPALAAALEQGADLRVEPDPVVARGGCLIDTEAGRIDGRLEAQLDAIERALCEDGS